MNVASILLLLQMAVSFLTSPNLNATQKAQALSFANQAVALASQVLLQAPETQLGVVATTTPEIIASTSAKEAPIPSSTPQISSISPQTPVVVQGTPSIPQVVSTPPPTNEENIGTPDLSTVAPRCADGFDKSIGRTCVDNVWYDSQLDYINKQKESGSCINGYIYSAYFSNPCDGYNLQRRFFAALCARDWQRDCSLR